KINLHFLEGTFNEGIRLIPYLEEQLQVYEAFLDRHRVLVFYYKIACLYFGSGKYEKAISYLNKIIHWKTDLRNDLQCYARLLHLIAHYELGHFNLLEYLIKSVYRFMAKMENLSGVEESMFKFLRKSFSLQPRELTPAFKTLLREVKQYQSDRFESRAFIYLDIISWLESKISGKPVQDIIRGKYVKQMK
ncbi:MAG: tetratricopeptide repeat protein, partial [Bacteroidota bacterium]